MNPAQKALWYIESHLAEPLTLDEIAGVAGVSRFHMVRAFAAATGFSVMRYVRARRLSKARARSPPARPTSSVSRWMRTTALTKHSPARSATISASRPRRSAPQRASIISSFRSRSSWIQPCSKISSPRVSKPPSHCSSPASANAARMKTAAPAFRTSGSSFHQKVDDIPARIGNVAYGVCCNGDDAGNFDYVAGVEVADFSDLPREFAPRADSRTEIRGLHPRRAHLDHPPHRQHDLESLAADIRHEGGRRAEFRAL